MTITFTAAMLHAAAASAENPIWQDPAHSCHTEWRTSEADSPTYAAFLASFQLPPKEAILEALDTLLRPMLDAQFPEATRGTLPHPSEAEQLVDAGHGQAIGAMLRHLAHSAPHHVPLLTTDQQAIALLDHSDN